jgi:flagellar hook assembly protein FlgD
LPEEATVSLRVYNILGQQVRELINMLQPAGSYEVSWDGKWDSGIGATSGVYFYKIEAVGKARTYEKTSKMVVLK